MNKRLRLFLTIALIVAFSAPSVWAFVQEPQSGGKFFQSKGTKSDEAYQKQGRPGMPTYEYGKGFKVGPAFLKPHIDYNYSWDSNIFLQPSDRTTDYIHTIIPGLDGELPLGGGQHLLWAGYEGLGEFFDRRGDQDHWDHTYSGGLNLNFVPFTLSLDDILRQTVDRGDTEFTTRISRRENYGHALLEIPFAQFFLETEVFDLDVAYRQPEFSQFDHNDFTLLQRVGYDLGPETQVLAEYGIKEIDYRKIGARDGEAHQAMLGLRGNWTSRITYQGWAGVQFRKYVADFQPDYHNFIARGALQYDISDKSNVVLKTDVSPQESTFDNQNFYVRTRFELAWKQQIRERLFFIMREVVNHNEYSRITTFDSDSETRRDWVWEGALGLEYLMPNDIVSFYGEYKYRDRESNFNALDYDASTITGGVRAKF